jgi:hypothetical protein
MSKLFSAISIGLVAYIGLIVPNISPAYAFPAVLGSRVIANQVLIDGQQISDPNQVFVISSQKPVFSGYTTANSKITLTIRSKTVQAETLSDANGHWSYTPEESLSYGQHSLSLKITDKTGLVGDEQLAATFLIREGQVKGTLTSFPSTGLPDRPEINYLTISLTVLGALLLLGTLYAFLLRRPTE